MKPEKEWALFYWGGNLLFLIAVVYSYLTFDNILLAFIPLVANFIWIYCWCSLTALQPVQNKGAQDR